MPVIVKLGLKSPPFVPQGFAGLFAVECLSTDYSLNSLRNYDGFKPQSHSSRKATGFSVSRLISDFMAKNRKDFSKFESVLDLATSAAQWKCKTVFNYRKVK